MIQLSNSLLILGPYFSIREEFLFVFVLDFPVVVGIGLLSSRRMPFSHHFPHIFISIGCTYGLRARHHYWRCIISGLFWSRQEEVFDIKYLVVMELVPIPDMVVDHDVIHGALNMLCVKCFSFRSFCEVPFHR